MLRQQDLFFWTTVKFEFEYFLNAEIAGVLSNTVMNFQDWHLTCLSQLKHPMC